MAENPCPIPTDMDAMCVAITAAIVRPIPMSHTLKMLLHEECITLSVNPNMKLKPLSFRMVFIISVFVTILLTRMLTDFLIYLNVKKKVPCHLCFLVP